MDTTSPLIFSELDSAFIDTSISSESSSNFKSKSKSSPEFPPSVPQVSADKYASELTADSGILENKSILDDSKIFTGFCSMEQSLNESSGIMNIDFSFEENYSNFKENDFHDAVLFFNDPVFFNALENAGSKTLSKSLISKDSLYQKFDPLYEQPPINHKEPRDCEEEKIQLKLEDALTSNDPLIKEETEVLQEINLAASNEVSSIFNESNSSNFSNWSDLIPNTIKEPLRNTSLRESLANKLISFNFPIINISSDSDLRNENACDRKNVYTEEDMQNALKNQELALQGNFLRKQRDLKEEFLRREQESEAKFQVEKCLCTSLLTVLKEAVNLLNVFSDKKKLLKEKLDVVEKDKNILKEDLDIFVKDLQNVKNTFLDFKNSFEESAFMLKLHIRNENLMQRLQNMESFLNDKEKICQVLQSKF